MAGYVVRKAHSEVKDILIADLALTVGFAILLGSGAAGTHSCKAFSGVLGQLCSNQFIFYLPIAFVAVSLTFILHEYMHKLTAQRFGAIAGFVRSDIGIVITLVSSLLGFLMGLPGATMIYSSSFTRKQEGITSLAGPLVNLAVFALFFALYFLHPEAGYLGLAISTVMFIALWLAFVNMLPISPLDGSKVLRWNPAIYLLTLACVVVLLLFITNFSISLLYSVGFVLVLSLILSVFARGILFRQ